ncbi:hypothetical protein EV356DRAFT_538098 [Viridothelium virens]|uniref:Uncharacterized protein n=1 Tax=Viridothelium virens TaxID=1048519 RepID=A0A6A6GRX9_VIRVR|nr:hypothetical protein EV356DRAFT_538098 [Viridothelium virens]
MYIQALQGKEEVLGLKHTLILNTVNNLGNLYANQSKLAEAERIQQPKQPLRRLRQAG